jgi:hypothetical protein
MDAKESAVAKSRGLQDERDMSPSDAALLQVLRNKKKISKDEANYVEGEQKQQQQQSHDESCIKCKFNLGDEGKCHVVEGQINNEKGISKFFSTKGDGMLPGDIVWMHVKQTGKKLKYEEGYVIEEGAPGFQCKDCKYYMYSGTCLFLEGKFKPEMSCGYIVKVGHGTEI